MSCAKYRSGTIRGLACANHGSTLCATIRGLPCALCSCDGCSEETKVGSAGFFNGCSKETEARSAGIMDTEHIEAFQRFVQSEFLDKKKVGSKVITKAKGALITAFLSEDTAGKDAHFKFWVKSRDFRLMDYPALGLGKVLCLPAKKKVYINS